MGVFAGSRTITGKQVREDSTSLGGTGGSTGMWGISSALDLIPTRPFQKLGPTVTQDTAMRHSAVWACLRLRANLLSTLPLDAFRNVGPTQVMLGYTPPILDQPGGPLLSYPGGPKVEIEEYLYSSQVDLDRAGNHIAVIAEVNGYGQPSYLEAAPSTECSVLVRGGKLWKYRIAGKLYDPGMIWHERQYTSSGLYVGLSPVAYAAWAIGEYLNVQEFATNWFAQGGVPKARLKNTAKTLNTIEAAVVKESWRASISAGEPFVHGSDWDYEMIQADQASRDWLDAKAASIPDVARFFDVPVDMIDGTPSGARTGRTDMTYANIGQRNAQLLVLNLGPSMVRREKAWSRLLPQPQYCQFRPDALFRLDPLAKATLHQIRITSRTLAPSEARADWNLPPFTDAQYEEFDHFWPATGNIAGEGPVPEGESEPADPTADTTDVDPELAAAAAAVLGQHRRHLALNGHHLRKELTR